MVTIICQYTGVSFEAPSKRSKNHPRVSALLNQAAKDGWYATAVARFGQARERGLTDLDEILQFVRTGGAEEQARQQRRLAEREQERKDLEAQQHAARQAREEQNAILREAGFRWRKHEYDEEDQDFLGRPVYDWVLHDTTTETATMYGDVVGVREAMERGAARGFVRCQDWLGRNPGPSAAERAAQAAAEEAAREQARQEALAAEQASEIAKRQADEQRAAAGASYAIWQRLFLDGLAYTTVAPPAAEWRHVYRAERGTPGAWYDTGDSWSIATIDGQLVFRCYYGNAVKYYAAQALVDTWALAQDDGSVGYAGHVLEYHNYGVYGSDVADRLVELRGLDHYVQRARSQEWLIKATESGRTLSRKVDAFAHYGVPMTPVRIAETPDIRQVREVLGFVEVPVPGYPGEIMRRDYSGVGQAPDGRWFATTDRYNGGGWRLLTAEERTALGLSADPPADPPRLPEARALPTRDETDAVSRRFSEMFSG